MTEDSSRAWKDQYMLRFPDGMRDRLKAEAAASKRSLNAEIIARLESTLTAFGNTAPAEQYEFDTLKTMLEDYIQRRIAAAMSEKEKSTD